MGNNTKVKSTISSIQKSILKSIPKVDECFLALNDHVELQEAPLRIIKKSVRAVLDEIRQEVLSATHPKPEITGLDNVIALIIKRIHQELEFRVRRVINATGVIIHTNLGRSLLPATTMERLNISGARYSNLEFDLQTGKRGSRYSLVEDLICELTGAEAALVVNNNAAAVLIVLDTLAKGKEVIVSRGQLVEIGGAFRIPDVMARSGASLVEVGATNRTHTRDYANAVTEETALLLKVHCSNYKIIGFTKEVSLEDLVTLGREKGIPIVEDLGSGCLIDLSQFGLEKEPTVQEVVASGVDVVTFSGDKLLGGPQAGIILGRKKIIDKIKKNPLNRAMRIDKFTLAGLESILRLYLDENVAIQKIPTLTMIAAGLDELDKRAKRLARKIRKPLKSVCKISVEDIVSRVGGGAMPEQNLPSRAVVLRPVSMKINKLEISLRSQPIPIIGRIEEDAMYLDVRTIADDEFAIISESIYSIFSNSF